MDNNAMMRDPSTAGQRIYVGNLPDGISAVDLNQQFAKHGTIRGIVINRGFGFIQFCNDHSAVRAIQHEDGQFQHGKKISVRAAVKNKQQLQQQQQQQPKQQKGPNKNQQHLQQQQQQQKQQNKPFQQQQNQQKPPQQQSTQSQPQPIQQQNLQQQLNIPQQQNQQPQLQQQLTVPPYDPVVVADDNLIEDPEEQHLMNIISAETEESQQPDEPQATASQQPPNGASVMVVAAVEPLAPVAPAAAPATPQPQQQQQAAPQAPQTGQPTAAQIPAVQSTLPQDLNRTARPYQARKRSRPGKPNANFNGAGPHDYEDMDDRWGNGNNPMQAGNYDNYGSMSNYSDYRDGNGGNGGGMPAPGGKKFANMGPHGGGPQMGGPGPQQQLPPHMQNALPNNALWQMRRPPQQFHQPQQQQQPHHQDGGYGGGGSAPQYNECEIIVHNPMQTAYAEALILRLRRIGLRTDLLYYTEGSSIPLGKLLSGIAARQTLYTIRLLPYSEQRRTINVFVMHSNDPNEHRNIPVDDALEMIANDYHALPMHMRGGGGGGRSLGPNSAASGAGGPAMPTAVEITPTSQADAPPLNQRHPDAIQTLVNLIADNRPVTVLQYDRVIQYLKERREFQLRAEIGDTLPPVAVPPPVDPEIELQRKILDIMSKPSITNTAQPIAASTADSSSASGIPIAAFSGVLKSTSGDVTATTASAGAPQSSLLADPKVQKALDSLLSGSMFNF